MDAVNSLPLLDRLRACAAIWAEAHDATLARLGKAVVNDGGFFTRLETQPQGATTATLEKFARFLGDSANWPQGAEVPAEVRQFGHVVGINLAEGEPSRGTCDGISLPPLPGAKAA